MTEQEPVATKPKGIGLEAYIFAAAAISIGIGIGAALSWGWGLAAVGAIVLAALLIPAKENKPKGNSE